MPSDSHLSYQDHFVAVLNQHAGDPDYPHVVRLYDHAIAVFLSLDLEPARELLDSCYASRPRGTERRDPIIMLRSLLLSILVGVTSINKWVPTQRASWLLRLIVGLGQEETVPGVGTHYDFMHRLHDGPRRPRGDALEPSELERERGKRPRDLRRERREAKEQRRKGAPASTRVTSLLLEELEAAKDLSCPEDLLFRLAAILVDVAVKPSFEKGLLGEPGEILIGGDGCPLCTGGNRFGSKPKDEHEGDLRIYTDPDAQWGWDSHRDTWYYGHHFYEYCAVGQGHDLPIFLRLDPANYSEMLASLEGFDQMRKILRDRMPSFPFTFILLQDAGHDSEAHWSYPLRYGVTPIIPLKEKVSPDHPSRPDIKLSPRGIPLCPGLAEMKPWGQFDGRAMFVCPVKGGAIETCPRAPKDDPTWRCRPDTKLAPTKSLPVNDNHRLTPPIPRDSERWKTLYAKRSGCERSNAVKKETFKLEQADHRRRSFWLIRLYLMAILQHAKAWVREQEGGSIVDELLALGSRVA